MAEVEINGVCYRQNLVNLHVVRCGEEPVVLCRPDWVLSQEELELVVNKLVKEGY